MCTLLSVPRKVDPTTRRPRVPRHVAEAPPAGFLKIRKVVSAKVATFWAVLFLSKTFHSGFATFPNLRKCLVDVFFWRGLGVGWELPFVSFPGASRVIGPLAICRARSGALVRRRHWHGAAPCASGIGRCISCAIVQRACAVQCAGRGSGGNSHRRMVDTCFSTNRSRRFFLETYYFDYFETTLWKSFSKDAFHKVSVDFGLLFRPTSPSVSTMFLSASFPERTGVSRSSREAEECSGSF